MPTYTYICPCGFQFEKDYAVKNYISNPVCPQCGDNQVNRNFGEDTLHSFVKLSVNDLTIGHLAHRNTERLSNDEKIHIHTKNNAYRLPKEGDDDKLPDGMKYFKRPTDHVPLPKKGS